jgi:hypothetical protein
MNDELLMTEFWNKLINEIENDERVLDEEFVALGVWAHITVYLVDNGWSLEELIAAVTQYYHRRTAAAGTEQ